MSFSFCAFLPCPVPQHNTEDKMTQYCISGCASSCPDTQSPPATTHKHTHTKLLITQEAIKSVFLHCLDFQILFGCVFQQTVSLCFPEEEFVVARNVKWSPVLWQPYKTWETGRGCEVRCNYILSFFFPHISPVSLWYIYNYGVRFFSAMLAAAYCLPVTHEHTLN